MRESSIGRQHNRVRYLSSIELARLGREIGGRSFSTREETVLPLPLVLLGIARAEVTALDDDDDVDDDEEEGETIRIEDCATVCSLLVWLCSRAVRVVFADPESSMPIAQSNRATS